MQMNMLYLTCQKPPPKIGPYFAGLFSPEVNNGVPVVPKCRTYLDDFSFAMKLMVGVIATKRALSAASQWGLPVLSLLWNY